MDIDVTRQRGPDLPGSYGKNCLVMLMCNPSKVYAFWEVSQSVRSLVLRLGPTSTRPVEELVLIANLAEEQRVGSAYLNVPSGVQVNLELGDWKDGVFQSQLVSNTLLLPDWNQSMAGSINESQDILVEYPLGIRKAL